MDQAKPVQEEMLYLTAEEGRTLLRKLQTEHTSFDSVLREYVVWVVLQASTARPNRQANQYQYHVWNNSLVRKAVRFLESQKLVCTVVENEEELVFVPVLEEHQLPCGE